MGEDVMASKSTSDPPTGSDHSEVVDVVDSSQVTTESVPSNPPMNRMVPVASHTDTGHAANTIEDEDVHHVADPPLPDSETELQPVPSSIERMDSVADVASAFESVHKNAV